MRSVPGPTRRVVVVGAGLGGLSAALRLAGAGREVTVVEREAVPGGRAGLVETDGFRFDTGPTVLTMPALLDDAFGCVEESTADWLDLVRLDPAYRAFFPDGTQLDIRADVDAMADEVARLAGAREADGYRRYVDFTTQLFALEMRDFIDRNLDSPLDLLRPSLARLAALGGFRRLAPKVAGYFRDPRLRRVFSFQALYAGLSPYDALAIYAVISHLDTVGGVYFPRGGMHAVPRALAAAADKHGVAFRYDTRVTGIEVHGGRATAVVTADGDRIAADAVVLNADLPGAFALLPEGVRPRPRRLRMSPSCVVLHLGSPATYSRVAHHNLHFGGAWRRSLEELAGGRLMSDPSLLVTSPTVTDPSLAPEGLASYYALALVPNLTAPRDWDALAPGFRDELLRRLESVGYVGLGDGVVTERLTTPADWARQGLAEGTPFSSAHTFRQTGPFRTPNLLLDNVVLAGSGTTPGVGVPMVLLSGRLAAERIVGAGVA